MRTLNQIADEMEQDAAERVSEAEALKQSAQSLRERKPLSISSQPKKTESAVLINYPGYNVDDVDLLPKIVAIENTRTTIWSKDELEEIIKSLEKGRAKKTLSNLPNRLYQLIAAKELYKVKINGSARYIRYFRNKEWIDKQIIDDAVKVRIKPENFRSPSVLLIREDYLNLDKVEWDSLNDPRTSNSNK